MKYLFLFTIGPVQTFIAQARKTRDLYRGSRILSELTAHALSSPEFTEIIFPARDLVSKPNRFIAIINKDSEKDVTDFGEKVAAMVQEKYLSMALGSINEKDRLPSGGETQLAKAVETYWAAVPLDSEEKYAEIYPKAEALLASVKNFRPFSQLNEPGARKCSLCGERNALFIKGNKLRALQSDAISVRHADLEQGEGLCAVCYTKRMSGREVSFESTAQIALMDTLAGLRENDRGNDALNDFDKKAGGNPDAQLYFRENLTAKYFDKNRIEDADYSELALKYKAVIKAAGETGLKFSQYYAIFMADADNMGDWISGRYLNDKSRLKEFQKTLSGALGKFASEMNSSLDGTRSSLRRGRTIYSGGDDFLGFINLNHLLPFMQEFRVKFEEIVGTAVKPFVDDRKITISGGAVIAHYKAPLSEVLSAVRAIEKEAKEKFPGRKDAFAISVMKHSGERETTCQQWTTDSISVTSLMSDLTGIFVSGDFSKTFMQNLERELIKMGGRSEGIDLNAEMLGFELRRLLGRACLMTRHKSESGADFKRRKDERINELTAKLVDVKTVTPSLSSFLSLFSIAEFISRYLNRQGE